MSGSSYGGGNGFSDLGSLKQLVKLELTETGVNGNFFSVLTSLPLLQHLDCSSCSHLQDACLLPLRELMGLSSSSLSSCKTFIALRVLNLSGCDNLAHSSSIVLKQLRDVRPHLMVLTDS
jgi:hypothetical protein